MEITILHANSNVLMTNGLKSVLARGGGVSKINNCLDEQQLFDCLGRSKWDLVILDPNSSDNFCLDTFIRIRKENREQKVLIISSMSDERLVQKILENGVQGYLTRECDEDELIHAIFAVTSGEKFYCNKVLDIILEKRESVDCNATILTERESEITALIAKGLTNKEIGNQLCLSHHTVHSHRKNIIRKLGVNSVSELTLYALNMGLIEA